MNAEITIKNIIGCDCKDFKENADEVNKPWGLWASHGESKGYEGKPFIYCPWCGEKLKEEMKDENNE